MGEMGGLEAGAIPLMGGDTPIEVLVSLEQSTQWYCRGCTTNASKREAITP